MSKPLPAPPAPDLAAMSIQLLCLSDALHHLCDSSMGLANQPRLHDTLAGDYIDSVWGDYLNRLLERVTEEMKTRVPADENEAEWKAEVIIRNARGNFHTILDATLDCIRFKAAQIA